MSTKKRTKKTPELVDRQATRTESHEKGSLGYITPDRQTRARRIGLGSLNLILPVLISVILMGVMLTQFTSSKAEIVQLKQHTTQSTTTLQQQIDALNFQVGDATEQIKALTAKIDKLELILSKIK